MTLVVKQSLFSLIPSQPATKKGANTVQCAAISWLLKISPCGKRCPSGPFSGPFVTSASGFQALAAECPCMPQLCFLPQLLMIPVSLFMICVCLLMISGWLLITSGWLLIISGWLRKFSSWLLTSCDFWLMSDCFWLTYNDFWLTSHDLWRT